MPSPLKPSRSKSVFNLLSWNNSKSLSDSTSPSKSRISDEESNTSPSSTPSNQNVSDNASPEAIRKNNRLRNDLMPLKALWDIFCAEYMTHDSQISQDTRELKKTQKRLIQRTSNGQLQQNQQSQQAQELQESQNENLGNNNEDRFNAMNMILKQCNVIHLDYHSSEFEIVFGDGILLIEAIISVLQIHMEQWISQIYLQLDGKLEKFESLLLKGDHSSLQNIYVFLLKTFYRNNVFLYEKFFYVLLQVLTNKNKKRVEEIFNSSDLIGLFLEYFIFTSLLSRLPDCDLLQSIQFSSLVNENFLEEFTTIYCTDNIADVEVTSSSNIAIFRRKVLDKLVDALHLSQSTHNNDKEYIIKSHSYGDCEDISDKNLPLDSSTNETNGKESNFSDTQSNITEANELLQKAVVDESESNSLEGDPNDYNMDSTFNKELKNDASDNSIDMNSEGPFEKEYTAISNDANNITEAFLDNGNHTHQKLNGLSIETSATSESFSDSNNGIYRTNLAEEHAEQAQSKGRNEYQSVQDNLAKIFHKGIDMNSEVFMFIAQMKSMDFNLIIDNFMKFIMTENILQSCTRKSEFIPIFINLLATDFVSEQYIPIKSSIFHCLSILIGDNLDNPIAEVFQKRKYITHLLQLLKPTTIYSRFSMSQNSASIDYISVSFIIQTIVRILEATQNGNPSLMKSFQSAAGYRVIQDALIDHQGSFSKEDKFMVMALNASVRLVYVIDRFSAENQLIMKLFGKEELQKKSLKNAAAFHTFSQTLLKTQNTTVQQLTLDEMLYLIAEYGKTSHIVHQWHPVALYIKNLDTLSDGIQDSVLKIVEFMIAGIDLVPKEELHALKQLLEGSTRASIIEKVLTLFTKILHLRTEFLTIFREMGIINNLVNLFASQFNTLRNNSTVSEMTTIMELATDVLVEVLKDNTNLKYFRDIGGVPIMQELVLSDYCRRYVLQVFQTIIVYDSIQNQVDVSVLVELLQTSPKAKVSVKTAIFQGLTRILKDNHSAKDSFAEGGFVASMSVIINSQWKGGIEPTSQSESDTNTESFTLQDQMNMFEALFMAITAALTDHPRNKHQFENQVGESALVDAILMSNIMNTRCAQDVMQCILDIVTERHFHVLSNESRNFVGFEEKKIGRLSIGFDPIVYNPFALKIFLRLLRAYPVFPHQQELVLQILYEFSNHGPINLEQLSTISLPTYLFTNYEDVILESSHPHHKLILSIVSNFACYKLRSSEWVTLFNTQRLEQSDTIMKVIMKASHSRYSDIPFLNFMENSKISILSLEDKLWPPSQGYTYMGWLYLADRGMVESVGVKKQQIVAMILSLRSEDNRSTLEFGITTEGQIVFNSHSRGKYNLFSNFTFEFGKWYHITITHSKYRLLQSSSMVSLFVNGKLIEAHKINYPGSCGSGLNIRGTFGHQFEYPLQGKRFSLRIGPSLLYEEVIPAESIPYFFMIGGSYIGLFGTSHSLKYLDQALSSKYISLFQQNRPETEESIKKHNNELASNRFKKVKLVPEKFVFSYNAHQIKLFDISSSSGSNRNQQTNAYFLINCRSTGYSSKSKAMLQGVYCCTPRSLSQDLLLFDGIKVVFAFIERADTSSTLLKNLELLCNLMRNAHYVIQEILRHNGSTILASFISKKIHLVNEPIIDCLWNMVIIETEEHFEVISFKNLCKNLFLDVENVKRLPSRFQIYLYRKLLRALKDPHYSYFNANRLKSIGIMAHLIRLLTSSPSLDTILVVVSIIKELLSSNPTPEDISSITRFLSFTLLNEVKSVQISKESLLQLCGSAPIKQSRSQKSQISTTTSLLASRNLILRLLLEFLLSEKRGDQMLELYSKHMDVRWFSLFLINPIHPSTIILVFPLWCALIERDKLDFTLHLFSTSIMRYSNQKEVYRVLLALQMGGTRGYLLDTFRNNRHFNALIERPWILTNQFTLPLILNLLKSASRIVSQAEFSEIDFLDCLDENRLLIMTKKYMAQTRWKLLRDFVHSNPFNQLNQESIEIVLSKDKLNSEGLDMQQKLVLEVLNVLKNLFKRSEEFRSLLQKQDNLHLMISIAFSNISYYGTKASSTGDVQKSPKLDNVNPQHMKSVPVLTQLPSPGEGKSVSTVDQREPYRWIFEQDVAISVIDVLRTIMEYYINVSGKFVRVVEEIMEEHPKMIATEIIDSYKETILKNFIQLARERIPKIKTCQITRSNLCASCQLITTYYLNGIITTYDVVLQYFSELIYHLHISETEKHGKNSHIGTKDASIHTTFKLYNRLFIYLLKNVVHDEELLYKFLKLTLDNDWLVAILNPLNHEINIYGSLANIFLNLIIFNDANKIREFSVSCMKLIVASGRMFIGGTNNSNLTTTNLDINAGLAEVLQNDSQQFIQWLLLNQDEVLDFFKSHYDDTILQYVTFIAEEKKKKVGRHTGSNFRKISVGRMDMRNEQYLVLKQDCQQMLDSLRKDHERKIQNQREQVIIGRNFASEQWKNLKTVLFHERAVWYNKEDPPPKRKQIDFADNPLRMRKKLIDLQTEEPTLSSSLTLSSPKSLSSDDLSIQEPSTPSPKESQTSFDVELLKRRRESIYLLDHVSKVEELLLSPNKRPNMDSIFDVEEIGDIETDLQSMNMTHNETETAVISDTAIDDDEYSIMEDEVFEDDMDEDFKIRKHLDANETILHTYNCLRVNGLDGQKALFVVGVFAMYVIDNYQLSESNEIVEVEDQAGDVQAEGTTPQSSHSLKHTCTKISFNNLQNVMKRRFLLLESAIEFFCKDGQSYLVVFEKSEMQKIYQCVPSTCRKSINKKVATLQWQRGELSNFEYLMQLNTLAGRSYNDLTQYPVFPWVLCHYDTEEIDLSNRSCYRDLSKPMGAITESRKQAFIERYNLWDDPKIPKFHYGSHYSSAAIVLYYMIRLQPFTNQNIQLQGGKFDIADRLFFSIRETFKNATEDHNMSDVKELIPEFYYLPNFLINKDGLNLGIRSNKKPVNDVELPQWCNNDIHEFIRINRKALESDIVSESLHQWIDLIFGYKQKGLEAQKAVNIFYFLTYEGAVDIDTITDPVERRATIAQISSFGQTPKQVFTKPHPRRNIRRTNQPFITEDPTALTYTDFRRVAHSVGYIGLSQRDQFVVLRQHSVLASSQGKKYLNWNELDGSVRIYSTVVVNSITKSHEVLKSTWENLHYNSKFTYIRVTNDGESMVTGDADGLVCIWSIFALKRVGRKIPIPQLKKRLCGHSDSITCIEICENYAFIVSGSVDGTCIIWDLNRTNYLLSLCDSESMAPISCIDVNHCSGDIVSCTANSISLWTLNGELIARTESGRSAVTSTKLLYENEWSDNYFILTGHQSGVVRIWKVVFHGRESGKESTNERRTRIQIISSFSAHTSRVTCFFISRDRRKFFSGDDRGHVLQWTRSTSNPASTQANHPEKTYEKVTPEKNVEDDETSNNESSATENSESTNAENSIDMYYDQEIEGDGETNTPKL